VRPGKQSKILKKLSLVQVLLLAYGGAIIWALCTGHVDAAVRMVLIPAMLSA